MRLLGHTIVKTLAFADMLALAVCLAAVWRPPAESHLREYILVLLIVPFWAYLLGYFGLYESHRVSGISDVIRPVLAAQFAGAVLFSPGLLATGLWIKIDVLFQFSLLSTATLVVPRLLLVAGLRWIRSRGLDTRRVCVIGGWQAATRLAAEFAHRPAWGLEVTCVSDDKENGRQFIAFPTGYQVAESIDELFHKHVIDEVLIVVQEGGIERESQTLRACEQYGIIARILLGKETTETFSSRVEPFLGGASLAVGHAKRTDSALVLKRMMDIVLGSLTLIVLLPLFVAIAVLVKLSSSGPVFFRQRRVGLNGREFTIYKFRTMVRNADELLPAYAKRNIVGSKPFKDPQDFRITPLGRVLRRCSLDELPQLFNVIKGEMSLVGPRPLPVHEAQSIGPEYRRRFAMKPGITCLWQVNGRSTVPFREWMNYDIQYVDKWSIWLDAKLLLQTIPAVLSGKGAY